MLGYESLIVGGFVRDLLLGTPSNDIDICTNMPQEEIEKHFKTIDIGKNKSFGVSIIQKDGFNIETAQYRKDVYNDLTGSKGADTVELISSFKEDAKRRDFTINSLGIDYQGNIVDHNNGTNDIKNKVSIMKISENFLAKHTLKRRIIDEGSVVGFKGTVCDD